MNINLNHINLSVADVPAARAFFENWFGFKSEDSRPNDTLSVLNGDDGFILVLMNEKLNKEGHTA
jgi:catechol 2,3-dioxygenase-like lactoylglutathione lyase family enzyme